MADLNGGKGKFHGVDENVNYAASFVGATKVAEKVKKGGSETTSDGYVVDAIDIDWGGLKLTAISDKWSFGLQTESSTEQNAGKGDNTRGIHSTAYLLNKISNSFTQIYNQIGKDDTAEDSLRKRVKAVEDSISTMGGLTPAQVKEITDNINLIKQELEGTPANEWATLVDKLAGINGTVKTYVDTAVAGAKTAAISEAASDATSKANKALSDAKTYADTKKSEAINAAASDATSKANTAKNEAIDYVQGTDDDDSSKDTIWGTKKYADEAATTAKTAAISEAASDATSKANKALSDAKAYADTKKSEAISAAASDATSKANTAKTAAISAAASDATSKANKALSDAKTYADTKKSEAINAAASDATSKDDQVKIDLIGDSSDAATADTIWGAKRYAVKTLTGSIGDAPTYETIYGVRKYTDEKIETLSNTAFKVRRIEEYGEGILVFSTVSSYAG